MADTHHGLGDSRIKLVDLGDGTYAWASATYAQAGAGVDARRAFKITPTIQAAAYAADDLVGGKQSIASFTQVSGGSAVIERIIISDNAGQIAPSYEILLFDSDPGATTFTENSPLTIADADLDRFIGALRLTPTAGTTQFVFTDNAAYYSGSLNIPVVLSGSATLYYAVVLRTAGATYAATTDLQITFTVRQD